MSDEMVVSVGGGGGSGRNPIALRDKEIVEESLTLLESLLEDCDAPTNEELKKLLGMQAAVLNNFGILIMDSLRGKKKMERQLRLAIKCLDSSRAAAEAAARID